MFYYNSNYKKSAEILKVVSYGDEPIDVDDNTCDIDVDEVPEYANSTDVHKEEVKEIDVKDVQVSQWVKVYYEEELFLGLVMDVTNTHCLVKCLEKPFGVNEPQQMERENDAVHYSKVLEHSLNPNYSNWEGNGSTHV